MALSILKFEAVQNKIEQARGLAVCVAAHVSGHDSYKGNPAQHALDVIEKCLDEADTLLKDMMNTWVSGRRKAKEQRHGHVDDE